MKTTTILFLGAVSFGCAQVHVDGGGSSASCGGETITTTSSASTSSGGEGGTGGGVSVCPDPRLGFDESDTPIGPLVPSDEDVASLVVVPPVPFDAVTTCKTVVLGLSTIGPCEVPEAIEIVSFDHEPATLQDPPAILSVIPLDDVPGVPLGEGAIVLRVPVDTYHAPGIPPLVGVRVRANVCPLVMPSCGAGAPLRYRTQEPEGWGEIDGVPALLVGLADCVTPG